jgi:hypothetical protein
MATASHATRRPTHYTPSGLGGSFEVHIVEQDARTALVEIHYTGDWNGRQFRVALSDLRPI